MLNSVIIMGRLTADPELRTTPNGVSVTSFTVAVDRRFQKQGEEKQTDFISVVAWRQTADFVTRFFKKGQMIAVQGSLQVRNYEDKTEISVLHMMLLPTMFPSAEAKVKAAASVRQGRKQLPLYLTRAQTQAAFRFYPMTILRDSPSQQMTMRGFRSDLF